MSLLRSLLLLATVSITLTLFAGELIFDFTTGEVGFNETLPVEKRGVRVARPEEGAEGILVFYDPYQKGKATWPYVEVDARSLSVTDWTAYKSVIIKLENPGQQIPDFKVTIRDQQQKRVTETVILSEKAVGEYAIDLTKLAGKIDLANIRKIDFALSTPAAAISIKLLSIVLSKEAVAVKALDPNRMVTRVYDLRPDLRSARTQGLIVNAEKMDDIQVSNSAWVEGEPRYPSLTISADQKGSLHFGDLGYMTHFSYQLEAVAGEGNYMGLRLRAGGKNMWHGLGAMGAGFPVSGKQQVWKTGLDMADMQSFAFSLTSSFNAHTFRIQKLQFEFLPEVLLEQVKEALTMVSRQKLNLSEREELTGLEKALEAASLKVQGETFRYQDAIDFNACVSDTKQAALELLRRHNARVLPGMTAKQYGVGIADSMTSVFLQGPGSELLPATAYELEMAGNEYESFQVVIVAGENPLDNVKVEVDRPVDDQGNQIDVQAALVGHVRTEPRNYPQEYIGYYPNFILSYQQSCRVEANETVPFWIRIKTPPDAVPGVYRTLVRISGADLKTYEFPVEIKVFNFSLPSGTVIPLAFHINDWALTRFYKVHENPEMNRKLAYQFIDLCAEYKIPYNQLYWEQTTADYRRDYFEKLKYLNDKGLLDGFAWCTLQLTSKPGHSRFQTSYWMSPDDPEIDRFIESVREHMEKWLPLCREFGIADKGYFYAFDEGPMNAATARILSELKKSYPDIPVLSCGRFGSPDIPAVQHLDKWVKIAPRFMTRQELVEANRKAGREVWWYLCNFPRPPEPSFMLEVPAAMPRLFMGMMTQKYQPDGFLYWAVTSWRSQKHEIISYGPRTNWNPETVPGDSEEGNLFGPGLDYTILPTVRVENFRDGLEDHWYYALLAREMKNGTLPMEPELLAEAGEALQVPESIVRSSSEYTVDPLLIRAQRRRVAILLQKLRKRGSQGH